jgi:cation diffusion facilitator family transporter
MTIQTTEVATATVAASEKRLAALASVGTALLLSSMKIVVGMWTNSIGILSEAAHSGLDLIAAGVTLWAVRASAKPADEDHPYGHGKIENFSALFETGLLIATCIWIVYESIKRLVWGGVHVAPTPAAFAVMGFSMALDFSRSRVLARAARKHQSQALEADALHFATDVWSSAVVLVGLALVWVAQRTKVAWLEDADAVAALGVASIALVVSLRLGRKSVDDLLDAAPLGLLETVARAAQEVPGVHAVTQVRVRRSGAQTFADVRLEVQHDVTFERAHEVAHAAEAAIRNAVGQVDVVVHADPVDVSATGSA